MVYRRKLCLSLVIGLVAVIPADGSGPARNGLIVYSGVVAEGLRAEVYAFPVESRKRMNISRHRGWDAAPALSPDGKKLAFLRQGTGWFLAASDGSGQRPLRGLFRDGGSVRWAPDSRHIVGQEAQESVLGVDFVIVVVDTETAVSYRLGVGEQAYWSPRGATVAYLGQDGLYTARLGNRPVRAVAERVSEFQWSPDGTRVAYVSESESVAVIDIGTGTTTKLTASVLRNLRWSPDATRLYGINPAPDGRLVSVRATGGPIKIVTAAGVGEFEFSPTGQIALNAGGGISVLRADGVVVREFGHGLYMSWSPLGRHLAFVRDYRLLLADLITGKLRVLAAGRNDFGVEPQILTPLLWRPDGSAVIAAAVTGSLATDLFTGSIDGTRARKLPSHGAYEVDPAWSPDGRSIAFTRYGETPSILAGDDRLRRVRLLVRGGAEPTWSPDGSRIAYVKTSARRLSDWPTAGDGIFVVGADGRGGRRITRGSDWSPAWSPDGSTLAFVRRTGLVGTTGIYLRKPAGGRARRIFIAGHVDGPRDPVPREVVGIAWSPDGRRLAFRLTAVDPDGDNYSLATDRVLVIDTGGKVIARIRGAGSSVTWSPDGRFLLHGSRPVSASGLPLTTGAFRVTRPDGSPVRGFDLGKLGGSAPSWQPLCSRAGSERADAIRGSSGADQLCGLGGADVLTGGTGRDRIFGQAGDDRIDGRDGAFDVIGCGEGRDMVFADTIDLVGVDCERVTRR